MTTASQSDGNSWAPSSLGKLFTGAPTWKLSLATNTYLLQVAEKSRAGNVLELEKLQVVPGFFWAGLELDAQHGSLRLDGLPNTEAEHLLAQLRGAIQREQADRQLVSLVPKLLAWATAHEQAVERERTGRGWLSKEFIQFQAQARPPEMVKALGERSLRERVGNAPESVRRAVQLWDRHFAKFADAANVQHLQAERLACADFFKRVEKSPLTDEQVDAVVCFDSRILLVASAGSGKTSTMVAKAGYAVHKGYFAPETILLLVFNNAAAAELRERIQARLAPHGLPAERITAKTFHSFGLDIIGQATGWRPSIAPWLESGGEMEALMGMVDKLKDEDSGFRASWDLFRVVFGQDLPEFGKEDEGKDSWDRESRTSGFWTLNGETVKSRGELLLANWLFYNGIEYEYERPYEHDTADAQHRQYTPDFYIRGADAYLEHWALDENGQPPPSFSGYLEGVKWKRALHKERGTKLLETTMAQLWNGEAFRYLEKELTALDITLDPNPERPAKGRSPIENPRLARTFRTFMVHAKSNRLSMEELRARLKTRAPGRFVFRHRMFLELYELIAQAWDEALAKGGFIDFEDMLVSAGDVIEQGRWQSPYELVMVDEFQDSSQARARILKGLAKRPRTCLFGVGDDWQSINRFAGSDLSVMTEFGRYFGDAVTMKLERTFRCAPSLCTITSSFVQKNPAQLRKTVRSSLPDVQAPVTVLRLDDAKTQARDALAKRIRQLQQEDGGAPSVLLLGRYRHDRDVVPSGFDPEKVRFLTVHTSKGLEGDHVIVLGMTAQTLGFPSRVEDDPVLQLALPEPEAYAFAEERRLFYVALTRARKTVTLVTETGRESAFVLELVQDHKVPSLNHEGAATAVDVCPRCGNGTLVARNGPYGPFVGCSAFPRCDFTRNTGNQGQVRPARTRQRRRY